MQRGETLGEPWSGRMQERALEGLLMLVDVSVLAEMKVLSIGVSNWNIELLAELVMPQ